MSQNDPIQQFQDERAADIAKMGADEELRRKSIDWMLHADRYKYTYNFSWMGRPIIKYPNDMVIQQELMWRLKPDLIVETGIAHGGSIIFSAAMMEMMGIDGEVVGIDIDIRSHNRKEIENHPMMKRITMIEGSSTDPAIFARVKAKAEGKRCVMVVLDSMHSHEHVYNELQLYPELVTMGSYLMLPDTFIELFPQGYYSHNRPWDVGDNPMTAMRQFLSEDDRFEIDEEIDNKLMITEGIKGYLRRVR
jgi:cephalosporin hydroxylase